LVGTPAYAEHLSLENSRFAQLDVYGKCVINAGYCSGMSLELSLISHWKAHLSGNKKRMDVGRDKNNREAKAI